MALRQSSNHRMDWQYTIIHPLLLAAVYLKMFENPDPEQRKELAAPKYPENYDSLNELIRRQGLFYLYRVYNGGLNSIHLKTIQTTLIFERQHTVKLAGP
ncbi:serine/threonine protein kinase [Penicillium malachiteum]|uniref:serine/threonine protein kinase n=1 Tax=Penicillium malachiteum TaxID=1324776 RepID=UPI00254945F7|nr:serine/threonine protein kinase [Penicillium malachiteum]KAJ5737218.1 serine/threonine protein kinase [Penicillium malachiteum]